MSSLAAQLSQSASLNTALLADRSKRKPVESFLFTGRDADQHDLDSIYALATNAFLKLCSLDQRFKRFEQELFSDRARALDRTLLGKEEEQELSDVIGEFLGLLGPWILEVPTSRVIEWLVRRFRVNEFNVESLLASFLPYHDTAHFAKLVTILHIKPSSTWSFLLPFKSAAQNVPRVSLVTEMLRNTDVARFVVSLLPSALKENRVHRVLLAFNAATLHEFISRSKTLDEGTMAYILPASLEPLERKHSASKDAILGSFILLSALSRKHELFVSALKVIVRSMTACAELVATKQFISAVIAVLEPQDELETLSGSTVKIILKISDFKEELRNAVSWVGSEKLIGPLVPALISRLPNDRVTLLLESILSAPSIPSSVVGRTTSLLIKESISEDNSEKAAASRSLLPIIQQRHPDIFQRTAQAEKDEDEELQEGIDQLILSLSLVSTKEFPNKDKTEMVVASASADTNVRVIAVRELLSSLSDVSLPTVDKKSITSALISRIQDPEQQVLVTLYEKPELLTPAFTPEASNYISALSEALGSKPKRSTLRLHLAFALEHLYPALKPGHKAELVSEILFPLLLFSKPRQHKAETAWDIIAENMSKEVGEEFEILDGCVHVVKAEREKAGEDVVEKMKNINAALSAKIAQNILMSNQLFEHLPKLLKWIESTNPHTRALGYLVTGALLNKLSGERRVDVAREILGVMNLEEISGIEDLLPENDQFIEALREMPGRNVVLKPHRQSTLSWLQVSLIAAICAIPPPEGLVLNWLSNQPSVSISDTRGSKYVALMRATYDLVNHSSSLPVLTSCLLSLLFVNLKSDVLAFLAGVWTSSPSPSDVSSLSLQEIALRHAAAFLEAHVLEDDGVDFQTIMPALLVALQSSSNSGRKAAAECLNRIRLISERKLRSVYKFDAVYGDVKDTLQYLDQDDLKRYLGRLTAHQEHCVQDPMYLRVVHAEHFTPVKSDKRKYIKLKERVLYYLLSHVSALDTESTKIKILESLSLVSSSVKVISLLPSIKTLPTHQGDVTLACLLISSIDGSAVAQMNNPEGGLWEVYLQLLKQYLHPFSASELREILIRLLETEIFDKLGYEKQVAVCKAIIEVVAYEPSSQLYGKKLLSDIAKDVPLLVRLLNDYAPTSQGNTPRTTKRAKVIGPMEGGDTSAELSFLAEILGTKSLPGSIDLIFALLDTLSKLIQRVSASQPDVNYIEQMLMSAIDNAASNISESTNITPSVVRLDVLVEIIRTVGNPQTFHQALLLMASLARLAPESVLHNVMPVFTFMGSNVFHRDDTYSFRVVQKTIDGIVPVMASSLKNANTNVLDLYIASRSFLQVFTDAANHIPRHRRNNFFIHLVDVLGPEHFLSPICMLLAEKVSNRVVRQDQEGTAVTLSLPITLLHQVSPAIQANVLLQFLEEAQRLVVYATDPINKVASFLDHVVDGEATVPVGTYVKRAHTLITLIGQAVQPDILNNLDKSEQGLLNSLVSGLINLVTIDESAPTVKFGGLTTAARSTLGRVLNVMPVVTFIEACMFMLASGGTVVHVGALELLGERIPKIADHVRRGITAKVNNAVELTTKLLAQDDTRLRAQSLRALTAIGSTLMPGEEGALAASLPSILGALSEPDLVDCALDALIPLSTKLGPRAIPFFKDIVTRSIFLLSGTDSAALEKASAVLHGLLTSIPAFWGKDVLSQMVKVYTDHCKATSGSPRAPVSSLMKVVAKKVPTNVLLPSLLDNWVAISSKQNLDCIIAYSNFLARAIRHASRASVLEQIKALSKIFLEALDVTKVSNSKESKAEIQVISAFKEFVVKLNESTFRPIFRRLYDWAFIDDTSDTARKITFFHTYSSLLDFFKVLMVPYTSFLLPAFETHFKLLPQAVGEESPALWISLVVTLKKSLTYDDGAFWRDDKLRQIATPLIQQVPLCTNLPEEPDVRTVFQQCLDALVENVSDDTLLKNINLGVLMYTRSENTKVRQFALICSESLWRTHGGKLLGFVSETSTFIAECGEDENDMVVKGSFKLKDAVESVAGKIDGL